jgi:hypothetical protein
MRPERSQIERVNPDIVNTRVAVRSAAKSEDKRKLTGND